MSGDRKRFIVVSLVLSVAASAAATEPLINVEFRPAVERTAPGYTFGLGLFLATNPGETQLFRAADVVFTWDPTKLQFLGIDNTGGAPLLSSTLPANDPYGLNGPTPPPTDGDGYYRAWAQLGAPLTITPSGTLLTTFRFRALAVMEGSPVTIAVSGGSPTLFTRVLGSAEAGTIVTGTLGSSSILIRPICRGDMNCDGRVDFDDIDPFVLALSGKAAYELQFPDCNWYNADCDENGAINFDDIDPFVAQIGSLCY